MGFADDAFAAFYAMLSATSAPAGNAEILARFPGILGISKNADGSKWIQVSTLTTGPGYDAKRFYEAYRSSAKLFDPLFFSKTIGELLFSTAVKFFLINVVSGVVLVAVFLLNGPLTLACMLPLIFAMIATLGTLNIMGRPLDIPGLMLSIIVFGIGIDYSIFFVRSYQRYGTIEHPAFGQIRMAVFLSAATTLLGFGAMWGADHSLLQSTGITAFLGIGYSMIGTFFILPPVLGQIQKHRQETGQQRRHASGASVEPLPIHGGLSKALCTVQAALGSDVLRDGADVSIRRRPKVDSGHRHRLRRARLLASRALHRGAPARGRTRPGTCPRRRHGGGRPRFDCRGPGPGGSRDR